MSTTRTIEERIREILINQLNVNEEAIIPTALLDDDLGADSLDTIELMMALEEEFATDLKGEITEEDAMKIKTVNDIYEYIRSHTAQQQG
jgi:acyl carrier protein